MQRAVTIIENYFGPVFIQRLIYGKNTLCTWKCVWNINWAAKIGFASLVTSLKSISETRKPTEATAEEVNYEFIFLTSLMYE